jgi:HEPN domain-containing protein
MGREVAREWLRIAAIDIKAARNCLYGPEPAPEAAAYHCQQAAEKVVKALLVDQGVHPPRSHDIGALIDLLPVGESLIGALAPLEKLTVFAIAYRYPVGDPLAAPGEPSRSDVEIWIGLVEAAWRGIAGHLSGNPP